MRKAQTATEYLIILSVVIIIALIVVSVLGGIPGMGGSTKLRTSEAYWRTTAKIAIVSNVVSPTGATLNLRNNYMDTITINTIYLDGNDLGITPRTLATGESASFSSNAVSCSEGAFSYDVLISYTDSVSTATYTFTGDGQTLDGNCANS